MSAQTDHSVAWVPADTLANRLVLVRRQLGLNQREAAARCGIGFGSWQSWENGAAPRNEVAQLSKIAAVLGVNRDWLLHGGPLMSSQSAGSSSDGAGTMRPSSRLAMVLPFRSRRSTPFDLREWDQRAGTG